MSKQITLRYLKQDKFNNLVFISGNEEEKEARAYKRLSRYNSKLAKKYPDAYLPIYEGNDYMSIKFGACKFGFSKGSYYTLDFKFTQRSANGKQFVNAKILKSKLHLRVDHDEKDIKLSSGSESD
jgi:hypothetical protein